MTNLYKKKTSSLAIATAVFLMLGYQATAQTQPAPQALPYAQNFDGFDGSATTYPAGIQGWQIRGAVPSTPGRVDSPSADRTLTASGTAASSGTGVYDYTGKIGIVCNNTNTIGVALALDTRTVTGTDRVRVTFDGSVIRNLYNGTTANIFAGLILQYRIGITGEFTNVGNSAKNTTTTQTSGTTPIDIVNSSFLLPLECSNQAVLQLRWTHRNISGSAGNRPSFAIDNITVNSETPVVVTPSPFGGYVITTKSITTTDNTPETFSTNVLSGVTRTQSLDGYGGAATEFVQTNPTGYFTTYKDARDVWYLLDPAGYKFYSIGVNTVVDAGYSSVSTIKSIYANTIGNFSDESLTSMPYTVRLNVGLGFSNTTQARKDLYTNGILSIFDTDFVTFCTTEANSQITAARIIDKNLVGYFSDNEVPLANPYGAKLINKWLDVNNYGGQANADANPNYVAAVNWIKGRNGGNIRTPNAADQAEFPGFVIARYSQVCRDAIKARDPNHLYIGSRLHQDLSNRYVFEAVGQYVDILTVNNYNVWSKAQLDARYNVWEQYTGKPFMVTEFYAQADDSGLPNSRTDGAGFNVATQRDRADFFEHYTMEMLKRKWNVGYHYFKLNDDAGVSNKGLLNSDYNFWEPMKTSFTKIAQDIYELRRFLIFNEQTLPITLKSFTAKADGEKVRLAWETLIETNNDRFEIQKSTDGINFTTIYTTKGKGNSLQNASYITYDNSPESGANYYKLIQFDFDGKFKEQGIRVVNFKLDNALSLSIYPNPVKDEVNIQFNNFEGKSAKITIYDLSGKMVHQEFISVFPENNRHRLNLKSQLKTGVYVLDFSTEGLSQREKLVVL